MHEAEIIERLDRIEAALTMLTKTLHVGEQPRRSHKQLDEMASQIVIDIRGRNRIKKKDVRETKTER